MAALYSVSGVHRPLPITATVVKKLLIYLSSFGQIDSAHLQSLNIDILRALAY